MLDSLTLPLEMKNELLCCTGHMEVISGNWQYHSYNLVEIGFPVLLSRSALGAKAHTNFMHLNFFKQSAS